MLITGKWRQEMTIGTVTLENPGDYIVCAGRPARASRVCAGAKSEIRFLDTYGR
jgi:hypothetical protein